MLNNQLGSVEVISFRTTRFDPEYKYPIEGVLLGTSVSHLALRLTFKSTDLFNKYIAGNKNIPYVDNMVTESGKPLYEVYFSFWPVTSLGLGNTDSRLNTHISDCEESALGSPMTYAPRFASYIHPDQKLFSSMIPILNLFLKSEATLPPAIIFHTTHFKTKLDKTLAALLPLETATELAARSEAVVDQANSYCRCLKEWTRATIEKQSLVNSGTYSNSELAAAIARVDKTNTALQNARTALKAQIKPILFAGSSISDEDFNNKLEDYLSFGKPEADTVTLPLVANAKTAGSYGLELEPMLALIKKYADNPKQYQYNLLTNNCATVALDILQAGAKNSNVRTLRRSFTLPWYMRLFDLPVSPTMVMDLAADAQHISGMQKTCREIGVTREQANTCKIAISKPRITLPQLDSEYILTSFEGINLESTSPATNKTKCALKR